MLVRRFGLRSRALLTFAALVAAVALGPVASGATASPTYATGHATGHAGHAAAARAKDPRRTRGLFVDPLMPAAQAADSDSTFDPIGTRAQALWITDHYRKPAAARTAVEDYTQRANDAHRTPLLAIYNIPDRDCGLSSSQDDDITDAYYRRWVEKVAAGLEDQKAIVVLEPDAVPFIGNAQCTGQGDRLGLLRYATRLLAEAGAWVYIDAGHSGWQTPEHMAPLLKKAGMKFARGFTTNVGNFRPTGAETTYARQLVRQLAERHLKGKKYLIETARNGAGKDGPVNGDVCNPSAARVGKAPKLRFDHAFDGRVWIKHPGESDGPCNGGPGSGVWWPDGARRLLGLKG